MNGRAESAIMTLFARLSAAKDRQCAEVIRDAYNAGAKIVPDFTMSHGATGMAIVYDSYRENR